MENFDDEYEDEYEDEQEEEYEDEQELPPSPPPPQPRKPPPPRRAVLRRKGGPKLQWGGGNLARGEAGELRLTIPAIPARGIAATVLRAGGSSPAKAAVKLARQASRLLDSSIVQSVMPPQARVALKAAKKLSKLLPKKWRRWF